MNNDREAVFDHERLDVYKVALQFVAWVTKFMDEVQAVPGGKAREACDHLERASLSALFNTAEGNGKRQMRLRGRFFDDARGSVTECAACLDALVAKGLCQDSRIREGKVLLCRVFSMLTKLVDRFCEGTQVHEGPAGYRYSDTESSRNEHENEDDDEDEKEVRP